MRYRTLAVSALAVLSACASPADDSRVGKLDFYDWVEVRRDEYAAALDQGVEGRHAQAALAHKLKTEIDRRYDAIVERAATEEDPRPRELAVSALGFSQRPEAVAHLVPRLSDPDPKVRGTAAAAVGFLNPSNPPIEKIAALLSDPDEYARQAALFSIKVLARPGSEFPKVTVDRIQKLAQEDASVEIRNEAVLALGRIQADSSIDLLCRFCLKDESALVRRNAALSLGLYGSRARDAVPFLIERLKDGETGVVEVSHWSLKAITGRVEADRQYETWADWLTELTKVLEFVCPSSKHPEEKASAPGSCPTCGLRMEPRAIPGAEFACPEHPEIVAMKAGKCPKCQKDLLPRKKEGPK